MRPAAVPVRPAVLPKWLREPHAELVSEGPAEVPRGLSLEVAVAGGFFCAAMSGVAATAFLRQEPPSLMLLAGWPLLALAAAAVLDRQPGATLGRALALLSLMAYLDLLLGLARSGSELTSADIVQAVTDLAGVHAVLLVGVVLWAVRPPTRGGLGIATLAVAVAGAALV